ncbi:MAG: amidohydrolase [Tenuifilaceae bacterium]|jgi:amidohydrolase|nr:amidohydrolase [Tenuifilaceae bacterium]
MSLSNSILDQLIKFRHQLHQNPELSGKEEETSNAIANFIKSANPTQIITHIGGSGIAAIFDSGTSGPSVLLRADMDALPIQESNGFEHRSRVNGVAHLCGHDGHTAILAGVTHLLNLEPIAKGRAVLLLQPAEETGQGAAAVIADSKFKDFKPDYAFALHNLPGFGLGNILIREGVFASASTGLIVRIKGLSSHAAHPEDGNNPDRALAKMILGLNSIAVNQQLFNDFALLTVIHAKLGEVAFGTTPGNATLMATLRTYLDSDMKTLKNSVEELIGTVSKDYNLKTSIEYTEEFPATINAASCISIIRDGVSSLKLPMQQLEAPFRWSEDFGHFSRICPSAMFGVGSGIEHPQLHNEDYDFPDEIIESSALLFRNILHQILG